MKHFAEARSAAFTQLPAYQGNADNEATHSALHNDWIW